jgi:hypothetical protein
MVPRCTTASGVMPSVINGVRIAEHWAGAEVFVAADDGSESDAVAHGSLHCLAVHVLVSWRLVQPLVE